jgi:putative ABC transport system substrate-binding protein
VKRRDVIKALVASSVLWPLTARAQQPAMPVIGFVNSGTPEGFAHLVAAWREGLKELGYIEGVNVAIEYRWAHGDYERLPQLLADLVQRRVAVIASTGGSRAVLAAKAATSTIPVVFEIGGDPVDLGVVKSLNRPEGNITGIRFFSGALGTKKLELLRELTPTASTIATLHHPNNPTSTFEQDQVMAAARTAGIEAMVLHAANAQDVDKAFVSLAGKPSLAMVVGNDPALFSLRHQITVLAAHHKIPAIYGLREYVNLGGLACYGNDLSDTFRQAGVYTARILKGEKPGDLPIAQATKFEFAINLKAAKALGLELSPKVLALADSVIE